MRYEDIPVSDSITMRPVWRRRQLRALANISPMRAPTDAEVMDAIRVLEDVDNERFVPELHLEAFRILDEAGR